MMLIGYARTSTLEQLAGLEAKQRDLTEYGCEKVYTEQISSVAERDQLDAALGALLADDKLVVTKLDRHDCEINLTPTYDLKSFDMHP